MGALRNRAPVHRFERDAGLSPARAPRETAMTFLDRYSPQLLSVLRIVAGLLLLEHGTAKLLDFPHTAMSAHLSPLLVAAGVIELAGGALIVLGLFSRVAAFIASGETAVAYWMVHVPKGGFFPLINGGDAAILFCFVFLYIAAAGPGPWAINRS
jgi:putative oxidoreductase